MPGTVPPPFLDVSCDNAVSPLDAVLVINELNASGDSEGEAAESPLLDLADSAAVDAALAQALAEFNRHSGVGPLQQHLEEAYAMALWRMLLDLD